MSEEKEGPWLIIEIGPLGFKHTKVYLETNKENIRTTFEGQVIVFKYEVGDFSTKFKEAWDDGRAVQALMMRLNEN